MPIEMVTAIITAAPDYHVRVRPIVSIIGAAVWPGVAIIVIGAVVARATAVQVGRAGAAGQKKGNPRGRGDACAACGMKETKEPVHN
jgi:hypothetical protein